MKTIIPFPAAGKFLPLLDPRAAAVRSEHSIALWGPKGVDSNGTGTSKVTEIPSPSSRFVFAWFHLAALLALCMMLLMTVGGCGGGYPGLGLSSVRVSAATLDAGQAITVTPVESSNDPVTWSLSGPGCSGSGCGTLTSMGQGGGTYTAPTGITAPMTVTITATVIGTGDTRSTVVAVDPDPTISGALPAGTVGVPYTATLRTSGGTGALTLSMASGTLPAGLTFNAATGVISGTPTTAGTASFVAQVTDSAPTPYSTKVSESIPIAGVGAPLTLLSGNPPSGIVGTLYTTALTASGGTTPYAFSLTNGALPPGLTLSATTGVIAGTPTTPGVYTFLARLQDGAGASASASFGIQVVSPLSLTLGSLPDGRVGVAYTSTIGVTGGTAPYTCTVTSGALPAGLALGAGCVVSGTPTMAGTAKLTIKATDSSNPVLTTTGPVSLTVSPAGLNISTGTLPAGTVGTPYSSTIGVTGGTSPYSCAIISGALQAGLTLGPNCLVSGTPTVAGLASLMVRATDSSNPVLTVTGPVNLTINPAALTITTGTLPNGTVGTPYSSTVGVTGGTAPYTCTLTSGTLQAGLTLGANCLVSGTPTAAGTANLTVQATDSSNPMLTASGAVSLTIDPVLVTILIGNPPVGMVGTPYTGTIPVSGGTGPYSCSLVAGSSLPAGLAFSTGCTLTGTPTGPGTTVVQIKATDSANPPHTSTGPVTITVQGPAPLTFTGTLPNAVLNQAYSQTLTASGGVGPYTYAVTSGTLPAGLNLNTGTGTISGTPTAAGASVFTVTATDSESTPQTAPLPLTLLVVFATTPNDALLQGPYAFLLQGFDNNVAGVLAYQNATVGSFTADGKGALTAGELDSNHQSSNSAGATIPTNKLIGTYTLGSNDRGTLLITTFNADGTVADTTTYAIAVKAPAAPATTTTSGSLIEANDGLITGQRGTGTFLQQTAADFTAGLTGSYAFGLQGDTPCFPACTANLQAGPVATVGRMVTAGGGLMTGEADTNIAQNNYPTAALSGTYGAADSNGRVGISLSNPNIPYASYPSDFAVYMVNGNQAFVMSTDQHTAYILLAGSMTSQTAATFSNASLSGQYVGYENAPTNPGLAGVAVQTVANLPTATLFQGTANSTGACTTNYVDQGGTTALVNGLTGQGSGTNVLNALLGTYASTGNSNCTVGSNGRAVLNYPVPSNVLSGVLTLLGLPANPPAPRVAYLTSTNAGYFLETGYAGLGNLERQTGAPFSPATLNGTYVYGNTPSAAAATLDGSGTFTADGAGRASYVLDESVLAGSVNAVTLGTTGSGTYVLTDAQNGRFTFNTDVIFAISPTRFVLVDTSATTTSPSVALIY